MKAHVITDFSAVGGAERAFSLVLSKGSEAPVVISLREINPSLYAEEGWTDKIRYGFGIGIGTNRMWPFRLLYALYLVGFRFRPQIIVGWMYHGCFAAFLFRLLVPSSRVVWNIRHSIDNLESDSFSTRVAIYVCGKVSRFINAIIYNSSRAKLQHEDYGYSRNNSFHIPNGVHVARFYPNKQPDGSSVFRVGTLGRNHKAKNQRLFIEACSKVRFSPVHFYIAGRDSSRHKEYIADKGMESKFTLIEETEQPAEFLNTLDVFVLSSNTEGFPNVLCEALACGVPCISTNVGDAELLLNTVGLKCSESTPEGIASDIDALLDKIARDGIDAQYLHNVMRDNYSAQCFVAKQELIYKGIQ